MLDVSAILQVPDWQLACLLVQYNMGLYDAFVAIVTLVICGVKQVR